MYVQIFCFQSMCCAIGTWERDRKVCMSTVGQQGALPHWHGLDSDAHGQMFFLFAALFFGYKNSCGIQRKVSYLLDTRASHLDLKKLSVKPGT
jgi:hypothetical protein